MTKKFEEYEVKPTQKLISDINKVALQVGADEYTVTTALLDASERLFLLNTALLAARRDLEAVSREVGVKPESLDMVVAATSGTPYLTLSQADRLSAVCAESVRLHLYSMVKKCTTKNA